jgi:DNA-binding PadR family transcriptional regulator
MEAKREVLSYVEEHGPADSETVALALGFATRAGSAATLLRLHRHGHLNRYRSETGAYFYTLSEKGHQWLAWRGRERMPQQWIR